jgi:hypothetical protein
MCPDPKFKPPDNPVDANIKKNRVIIDNLAA